MARPVDQGTRESSIAAAAPQRVSKILASRGVCSRREAERLIADGPQLDRADEHYDRLVVATLRELGLMPPGAAVSALRSASTRDSVSATVGSPSRMGARSARPR